MNNSKNGGTPHRERPKKTFSLDPKTITRLKRLKKHYRKNESHTVDAALEALEIKHKEAAA